MQSTLQIVIIICTYVFFLPNVIAQKTKLTCYVTPINATIILDGKPVKNIVNLHLDSGKHHIKVTSFKYVDFDTVFNCLKDTSIRMYIRLKQSPLYLSYQKKLKHFRKDNVISIGTPIAITLTSLFTTKSLLKNNAIEIKNQLYEANNTKWKYDKNINPDRINELAKQFYKEKSNYEKLIKKDNTIKGTGYGILSISAALSVYIIIKISKKEKPSFEKIGSLTTLNLTPYCSYQNTLGLNLKATF